MRVHYHDSFAWLERSRGNGGQTTIKSRFFLAKRHAQRGSPPCVQTVHSLQGDSPFTPASVRLFTPPSTTYAYRAAPLPGGRVPDSPLQICTPPGCPQLGGSPGKRSSASPSVQIDSSAGNQPLTRLSTCNAKGPGLGTHWPLDGRAGTGVVFAEFDGWRRGRAWRPLSRAPGQLRGARRAACHAAKTTPVPARQ